MMQDSKTYEVEFSTEAFRHLFYISCPAGVDAKTFAHAVFHYYDTPPEWGRKLAIRSIAEIKPGNCLPDFLHVACQAQHEVAMPDESEESHRAVRKLIRQIGDGNCVPMAIYDSENRKMMVYATNKVDIAPQAGAVSVAQSFSLFGDMAGKFRTGDKKPG
jgi:hypothetical protein